MKTYTVREYNNGDRFWLNENGQLHREDGPALELKNGRTAWYLNDVRQTDEILVRHLIYILWDDGLKYTDTLDTVVKSISNTAMYQDKLFNRRVGLSTSIILAALQQCLFLNKNVIILVNYEEHKQLLLHDLQRYALYIGNYQQNCDFNYSNSIHPFLKNINIADTIKKKLQIISINNKSNCYSLYGRKFDLILGDNIHVTDEIIGIFKCKVRLFNTRFTSFSF